jgi:cytochrome oxidase assembly protein ShyY1
VYGFLKSPRWIGFMLLTVVLATTFVELGFWQLRRLDARKARNAIVVENLAVPVTDVAQLLEPARPVTKADEWRRVSASGRWDAAHQLVVRNRSLNSAPGYLVLTPFVTDEGKALLVERGWVPAGASAATRPAVPSPTGAKVSVVARVRRDEPAKKARDLPAGEVLRINAPSIANHLPYPTYDGYAQLVSQQPALSHDMPLAELPDLGNGPHLIYAVQWFIFTGIAFAGFFVFVRNEALARTTAGDPIEAAHPPVDSRGKASHQSR